MCEGTLDLDGEPADGLTICVLVPTARHGQRQFRDGVGVKYRSMQLYINKAPPDERLEFGWDPFTQFQAIAQDEGHAEQVLTFTSTSWGGRNALEDLSGAYLSKGERQFPICALGLRPKKNDPNGNIDPVFRVVGWKAASDFADMLADMLPQPAAQPLALEPPKREPEVIPEDLEPGADPDDSLPF